MRIKRYPCDDVFSQLIRLRDMECVRCHSKVRLNDKGLPVSHEASHYFGRGKWNTRFDTGNVDTLCFACHKIWGSDDKEGYKQFKLNQLGEDMFDLLMLQANSRSQLGSNFWKRLTRKQAEEILKSLFGRVVNKTVQTKT